MEGRNSSYPSMQVPSIAPLSHAHRYAINRILQSGRAVATALIAACRFLCMTRFRPVTIPVAMAVTVPVLDELGVDLLQTIKAFAVVSLVREWHEFFKLFA